MTDADVVIVGGGFTGMCAARALADGRRKIVVLEALNGPAQSFRGELMHPLGVDALARLGLLEPLQRDGGIPVDGFAVALGGTMTPIPLPYGEIAGSRGHGLVMSHPAMVNTLRREVAGNRGVELRMGARVSELIREGGAVQGVRMVGGDEVRAPLTIVSDGRHSKLRDGVGAAEETRLLSFTAAFLTEAVPLPREGYGHVFLGAWGPILAYAVKGGRVRLCIDLPVEIGKKHEAVLEFIRTECMPNVPEPLRSAIGRAIVEAPPELCATHAITTRRCTSPGVALVGDSGGCAHPLTAGGMTIALNDISTLAEELDRTGTVASALERYQDRRYGFVRAREIVVDVLYDLFRRDDEGAKTLRQGLLRYWNSGPRARSASMSLLSGRESRISAFVAEYLAVVSASARGALEVATAKQQRGARRAAASHLAVTSFDQLTRTAKLVYLDLRRRPTLRAGLFTSPRPRPAASAAGA